MIESNQTGLYFQESIFKQSHTDSETVYRFDHEKVNYQHKVKSM